MDVQPKRPGSITFLLVGLVLLVTAAGVLILIVPLSDCPNPIHLLLVPQTSMSIEFPTPEGPKLGCDVCHGRKRVTLFRKWISQPQEVEER
jgi:hypothetical protein